ncbi:MAG: outer membrane beta-barrel protein [Bacteroidota bacterium]
MQRLTFICFFIGLCFLTVNAQDISYGFRVGLNFSSVNGPEASDASGASLESTKANTGFHVGGGPIFRLSDRFGVKAEVLFSQKGGEYSFEGNAIQLLTANSGRRVRANGLRRMVVTVTNSYIDLPITGYAKLGEKFEVWGGANIAFLVGSNASGELGFDGVSAESNTPIAFTSALDYNYFQDEVPTLESLIENTEAVTFDADGETITVPDVLGSYFEFEEKDGNFYNTLDVGLIAGASFYLNRGLFVSFAVNYGLVDATNEAYDVSRTEVNGLQYIQSNDNDNNLSLQASVGFSF